MDLENIRKMAKSCMMTPQEKYLLKVIDELEDKLLHRDVEIIHLKSKVNDYENGITWMTACTNCAKLMDENHVQYEEIRKLKSKNTRT